ncbi:MAG: HAD family hydrolase [Pseudonocardia sp.]
MLRGVLFDFNGTLARLSGWGAPHHEVFARHNLLRAAARWGDGWLVGPADGEVHEAHSRSRESYHRWELDRLRSRARACGVPEARIDPLVFDLDRETKAILMEPYEDVVDALVELRRRDVIIAVCSNWYWDLDKAIDQAGLTGMFTALVTSARAGMRKPDPRIYRHTLRRCDLRPHEALFVGDMWVPDVEGPRAIGMRAAHLWRPERAREEDPPLLRDGIWRVSDLPSAVDLVEELSCPADPGHCG